VLTGPFENGAGLICLPVRRGEREFGVMNLVFAQPGGLDERTRLFIGALLDETALGLEGVSMRRRELSVLRQVQSLRQKSDLTALLNGLLNNLSSSLEADFAVMRAQANGARWAGIDLSQGDFPPQARPFVDGLLQGVMASGEPVLLSDLAGDPNGDPASRPELKSLAAAPLLSPDRTVLGAILAGVRRGRGFQHRQLALLQTIAGQVSLVVQNASLMAELEYQTMLQERARLAREIHDGLAQTIGFLKLQAAQLRLQLASGDEQRAKQSLDQFYATLTEAYQDARQAIDGLRVSPDECGLVGWLGQIAAEFQDLSGLPVHLEDGLSDAAGPAAVQVSPEIQAQLIRIIQEALSNVRKHARASQVWLAVRQSAGDLLLEVRDNGDGFTPQDITSASRHGLRSMRERAELIGADFQVISLPGEGATVRVRLPLKRPMEVQP
jgi:two-component system nitrate/nitrite sensor histidine kinase NarX